MDKIETGDELAGPEAVTGKLRKGTSLGELAFSFGMKHLYSARAGSTTGTTCLSLMRSTFLEVLKLFPEDQELVTANSILSFDVAKTARSHSKTSVSRSTSRSKESRGSGKEEKEDADDDKSLDSLILDSDVNSDLPLGMESAILTQVEMLKRHHRNMQCNSMLEAASEGNLQKLQRLVPARIGVNETDKSGRTALHVSASEGRLEVVQFLLSVGADANLKDAYQNTALNDAVRHKHDEVAACLRDYYRDKGALGAGSAVALPGCAAAVELLAAAHKGDLVQVERLISNGVKVNETDYDGVCPLHSRMIVPRCVCNESTIIASVRLISSAIDVCRAGRTALHLAACEGHTELVSYLLKANADANARDRFDGTALHDSIRHHAPEAVNSALKEAGCQLIGMETAIALCEASHAGNLSAIRTLVENGVEPNLGDYDGRTALHLAASEGIVPVLHYLLSLEPKIDVNPVDVTGGTPLDDAIRHQQEVCETMLRNAGGLTKLDPKLQETQRQRELSKKEQDRTIRRPQIVATAENSKEVLFYPKFEDIMRTFSKVDEKHDDEAEELGYVENEDDHVEALDDKLTDAESSSFCQRLNRFSNFFLEFTSHFESSSHFLLSNACSEEYVGRLAHAVPDDELAHPASIAAGASMSFCHRLQADKTFHSQALPPPVVVGRLVVECIRADGLPKMDRFTGKADPYLVLRVDGGYEQRTNCIPNTLHPVWGETFTFENVAATSQLHVELFDQEVMGKDRTMGSFHVPVARMAANTQAAFDLTKGCSLGQNKGPATGRVYMSFAFTITPQLPMQLAPPLEDDEVALPPPTPPPKPIFAAGFSSASTHDTIKKLRITLVSVKHLPASLPVGFGEVSAASCACLVTAEWEGQTYSTAAIGCATSLEWNETCTFAVKDPDPKRRFGDVKLSLRVVRADDAPHSDTGDVTGDAASAIGTYSCLISGQVIRDLGEGSTPVAPGSGPPGAVGRAVHEGWRMKDLTIPVVLGGGMYLTDENGQICCIHATVAVEREATAQLSHLQAHKPGRSSLLSISPVPVSPQVCGEATIDDLHNLQGAAALAQKLTEHLAALRRTVPQLPESSPTLYKILAVKYEKQRQDFLNGLLRNAFLARHIAEILHRLKIADHKPSPS